MQFPIFSAYRGILLRGCGRGRLDHAGRGADGAAAADQVVPQDAGDAEQETGPPTPTPAESAANQPVTPEVTPSTEVNDPITTTDPSGRSWARVTELLIAGRKVGSGVPSGRMRIRRWALRVPPGAPIQDEKLPGM